MNFSRFTTINSFPSLEEILSALDNLRAEYYLDTQGIPQFSRLSSVIDEAALARILTKLAVGTATVWWSLLEIKEVLSLYQKSRKNKVS
jgi:hypothetical protein